MAIKPPAILLPSLASPLSSSHHLAHCPRSSYSSPSPSSRCQRFQRRYATASPSDSRKWSDSNPSPEEGPHEWPKSPRPTPYEVLGISNKGAVYDKRRFYHLVKLYHPDTHDHHHDRHHHHHHQNQSTSSPSSPSSSSNIKSLPPATRLERYRMVVAANELLSSPPKRRLYDTHGLGWSHGDQPPSLRDIDRSWRHQQGSAANNATWEDWERWREAQQGGGKASEPVYMSHGAFASIVVLMCLVGAIAQTNRAEATGAQYVGWAADHSADIGGRLRSNGSAVAGLSKDERVDYFLRERENVNFQFVPSKDEATHPARPS
ncbi:hypothetical protein J3F83DRAFT_736469 [Trichoderma novae-zelandiae]